MPEHFILHASPPKPSKKERIKHFAKKTIHHLHPGRFLFLILTIFWRVFKLLIKRFWRYICIIFPKPLQILIITTIFLTVFFIYSYFLITLAHDLPDPHRLKETPKGLTTDFYDRSGKLLYKLYEGRNRELIQLTNLPPYIYQATIAIEDQHFYHHPGFDVLGIIRALKANLKSDSLKQGGSTITQQLIKNTLLTPDRTWKRKIKEALLSFWAEQIFSKDEILQMYLNEVPYGGTAWGIEAAAQSYFGKPAKQLRLSEAAYLAALPAAPTLLSPYGPHSDLGLQRQKEVLERMAKDGYITPEQAKSAAEEELKIKPPQHGLLAPHFVMYAKAYLEEKYGSRIVSQGGLKVITTLDLELQEEAEKIVQEELSKISSLKVGNGAAMIEDPKTGQILVMVGSKDYYERYFGNYNVAVALRQPGSSIKPLTYAAAFKKGYSPGNMILDNATSFPDGTKRYTPKNYDGTFHGLVSLRTSLGSSFNIPAVKVLSLAGIEDVVTTAKDLGLTTLENPDKYGLSLTLGSTEVRLIDMITVYSTFSQMGVKHKPTPVLQVTDADGVVLEDHVKNEGVEVLNPGIAYMVTDILSDNKARTPAFGSNSLLNIPGFKVPVKTGTSDNKKDNWTFGYTPDFVVGVWVGNNDGSLMDDRLTSGVTGAAPIWNRIMAYLLANKPYSEFIVPDNIRQGVIEGNKDIYIDGIEQKTIIKSSKRQVVNPYTQEEKEETVYSDQFGSLTPK